ncbi:hypothetical protein EST38_g12080, partial [Candolleomyces aberdarensis]
MTKLQKTTLATSFEEIPLAHRHRTTSSLGIPRSDLDGDSLPDPTITTGWDARLRLLLLHGVVSLCWGSALAVFSAGAVPITWALSEQGKKYPQVTNVIVTLVSTLATTHVVYVLQGVCDQYASYLVVAGFTIGQLRWMQGVKERSIFTKFPDKKKWIVWFIVYAGLALHSASVVAILQPVPFWQHVLFGDSVPCGSDPNGLTMEPTYLDETLQRAVDKLSFTVGMQLGNYNEQVAGNTTSRVAGRAYSKDSYAYGALGGLENGLLEVPGVQFVAQCSSNPTEAEAIWRSVFPERSLPEPSMNGRDLVGFNDAPVPAQMRGINSEASAGGNAEDENISDFRHGLYALVQPTADGALMTVEPDGPQYKVTVCSWKALPKLVHAQTVNSTARSLSVEDAKVYPSIIGRATWSTLEGMARAARWGASLQPIFEIPAAPPSPAPPPSQVLEIILADGGKAAMTFFNVYAYSQRNANRAQLAPSCSSNNRTVSEHWKFGNARNLGYIAIVWTTGIGTFAIVMAIWLKPRRRVRGDWTLGV